MKKVKFKKYFLGIASIFCICNIFVSTNVKAAYAYIWTVDGHDLNFGESNSTGTATWESDDNYNGGQIKLDCYGTGMEDVFAIKLVGDNKITVKDGIGIVAGEPIVFIGDGTLTIEAGIPISGGFYVESIDTNEFDTTTITIKPSVKKLACPDADKDSNLTEDNETNVSDGNANASSDQVKENSSDNNKLNIILLSCVGVNIAVFLLLIIMMIKNTKKNN